ncbi:MAG: hypothetical protein AAF657_16970 [Acidobacteriota bacterium]
MRKRPCGFHHHSLRLSLALCCLLAVALCPALLAQTEPEAVPLEPSSLDEIWASVTSADFGTVNTIPSRQLTPQGGLDGPPTSWGAFRLGPGDLTLAPFDASPDARLDPPTQETCRSGDQEAFPHKDAMSRTPVEVVEDEPNDTLATADPIAVFGTCPGQATQVNVSGTFDLPEPVALASSPEADGAIPLATPTWLEAGKAVRLDGRIGDGSFGRAGSGSGDFDFYAVTGVEAGQVLSVDVAKPSGLDAMDPFAIVWSPEGLFEAVAFAGTTFRFTAPADGDYYVSIGASNTFQTDPFDPSSGLGAASEGDYSLVLGLNYRQVDLFDLRLRAGDVLSAVVDGEGKALRLIDTSGVERRVLGIDLDRGLAAPLVTDGFASLAQVVERAGTWTLAVEGSTPGSYTLELRVFRPGFSGFADSFDTPR